MRRAFLESVREEIRRTGCGLVPPPHDYERFRKRRLDQGSELLSRRLVHFRPTARREWQRLARVAGQGAVIGVELGYQLCVGREHAPVVEACSLLNLLVACFDGVLDTRPASVPELLVRITPALLDEALDLDRPRSAPPVFDHQAGDDPAPGFVAFVAEEAFRLCRELVLSGGSRRNWSGFATSVRDAYDAEVATLELGLDNTPVDDEALVALRRKSILPVVMMGQAVLLSPDLRASVEPVAVIQLMETVGSLVGEIDDVVDLPADLDAGRWSAFLLGTCRLTGGQIRRMGTAGSISTILDRQIPRQAAARIAQGMHHVAKLSAGTLLEPDRFLDNCRCWLAGWLVTGEGSVPAPEQQPRL